MRTVTVLLWMILLGLHPLIAFGADETPTHTQTLSDFPGNQASYFRDSQKFLADEDALRYRLMFPSFVAGGWSAPATSVTLSHNIAPLEAFVNGFYVFQSWTFVTYAVTARTFIYVDWFDTRTGQTPSLPEITFSGGSGCTTVTRYTRLLTVRCNAGSVAPTASVSALLLFHSDTSSSGITAVQLLAAITPIIGGGGGGAISSITGTPNQINVSSPVGAVVLSIPNNPTLPGTVTAGGFLGPLIGNVTGNASTSSALFANGDDCLVGNAARGTDPAGVAEGCFDVATQAELDTHTAATAVHGATGAVVGTTNTQTLQNKTLDNSTIATLRDDQTTFQDNADISKQAIFELSGIPTSTTRTVTIAGGANSTTVKPAACPSTDKIREIQADGTIVCDTDQASGGGTGITTLNTLEATTQSFATGTAGADFGISSTTSTHTFNLPDASATARGVVTTGAQTLAGAKTFSGGVIAALTGNASTSTALEANPADCPANQFGTAIAANGDLTCAQVSYTQLSSVPSTLVKTDQGNTYSTGAQNFAAATSVTLPTAPGVSPTSAAQMAYDSTSHTLEVGVNGSNKTVAMTDSNITGNAATATLATAATALAADGTNCSLPNFPLGISTLGAAQNCTPLPTTITGTANQITASAATGAVVLSVTTNPTLPGTVTAGAFAGPLTGNASTSTALAANGGNCPLANNAPAGVDSSGVAEGCFDVATVTTREQAFQNGKSIIGANSLANAARTGTGLSYVAVYDDPTLGPTIKAVGSGGDVNTVIESESDKDILFITAGVTRLTVQNTGDIELSAPLKFITAINKSIYVSAGAFEADETQCAAPSRQTLVTTGPIRQTIVCADHDAGALYFDVVMPDSWNAGSITVENHWFSASNLSTQVVSTDWNGFCVRPSDPVANHGNTAGVQTANVTFANQANDEQHATTAAITLNGTCAAGAHIYLRGRIRATATTATMTNVRFLGIKIEYGINVNTD